MYTYAHPIEDALENVTHSICTLEFEDQRPFYDWLLDTLCSLGLLLQPRPHQYEFARLNVTYVITSKRKLKQLVDEQIVDGWDDPRMPTIAGLRRRGYTPDSIRLLCERAGTSKAGGWTDYASLEIALRDDLDAKAPRAMAVLDPVRLALTNITRVLATIVADTKSGTPGADAVKVKGTLTWLAVDDALAAEVRLYDRLFVDAHPDAGGKDFKASLNPASKQVVSGFVERSLVAAGAGDRFQFERHGYFVADIVDHGPDRPVFNRTATLRDTWSR